MVTSQGNSQFSIGIENGVHSGQIFETLVKLRSDFQRVSQKPDRCVQNSSHDPNIWPLGNQASFDHLNKELVQYSDPNHILPSSKAIVIINQTSLYNVLCMPLSILHKICWRSKKKKCKCLWKVFYKIQLYPISNNTRWNFSCLFSQ